MGSHVSRSDFTWTTDVDPHRERRRQILREHPKVRSLMGYDPYQAVQIILFVLAQLVMCYLIRDASWPVFILVAYLFGGTLNHSLTISFHEIGHNLVFGQHRLRMNRLFGIVANLPIGVPSSITFKKYHLDHHKFFGDDFLDSDLPTKFEAMFFNCTGLKVLWIFMQPIFYALRPYYLLYKPVTGYEFLNMGVQLCFDLTILQLFGPGSLLYLLLSTLLGMGFHPISGHFISEHYQFIKDNPSETYSYYGPLNWVVYNVGYHNEHHDFPNIPGSRLPQVKALAPEFYEDLPCHSSWIKVLYDFITEPSMGPYARIRRQTQYSAPFRLKDGGFLDGFVPQIKLKLEKKKI